MRSRIFPSSEGLLNEVNKPQQPDVVGLPYTFPFLLFFKLFSVFGQWLPFKTVISCPSWYKIPITTTFLQNHHPPTVFSVMTTETYCLPKTNQLPYTQDHPAHYSFPPFSDKRPPNYPSFPSTCPLLPTPEVQAHSVILPEMIIPTICHQLFLHLSLKWG